MIKFALVILTSLASMSAFAERGGDVSGGGGHPAGVVRVENVFLGQLNLLCKDHEIQDCRACEKYYNKYSATVLNQRELELICDQN